ncbi:uncharacterized protein CIMG_04054 [Coccidioides immitis RS]|uniref:Uncharacterized protein n=1 Tax=Coccidioides immitis (strain RS) TaxID=246410 RepID=J3KCP2_COCIM|nr:uncharacterized protein CIMG_04054 [Coccidioides immitis RS]EAS33030.3 hypothetical protein CIMG_04054 [Coccidioides immitis RS]
MGQQSSIITPIKLALSRKLDEMLQAYEACGKYGWHMKYAMGIKESPLQMAEGGPFCVAQIPAFRAGRPFSNSTSLHRMVSDIFERFERDHGLIAQASRYLDTHARARAGGWVPVRFEFLRGYFQR